jgi:hypothetical protein
MTTEFCATGILRMRAACTGLYTTRINDVLDMLAVGKNGVEPGAKE